VAAGLSPALSWALRVLYLAREAREERELRVCFLLVAILMSSLPAHDVGRKTLKRPGSTTASGEVGRSTLEWIRPEIRVRSSIHDPLSTRGNRAASKRETALVAADDAELLTGEPRQPLPRAPPAFSKLTNRFRLVRAETFRRPRPMRSEAGWAGVPSTTAACPWLGRDGPRCADGLQTCPLDRIITAGPRLWRSRW
jgi:hypothetical protein